MPDELNQALGLPVWEQGAGHITYWHFSATEDHITPVAAGGLDSPENLVSTSMMTNREKGDRVLDVRVFRSRSTTTT
ncbi:MAG: HNH endonuclease domain-containing protein [Longimicrobiales bacterium]